MAFDLSKISPFDRKIIKLMRTPDGVLFAGKYFWGQNDCEVVWIETTNPVQLVTTSYDCNGNPVICFADIKLYGDGEDGDEGNIRVIYPEGTVELAIPER